MIIRIEDTTIRSCSARLEISRPSKTTAITQGADQARPYTLGDSQVEKARTPIAADTHTTKSVYFYETNYYTQLDLKLK